MSDDPRVLRVRGARTHHLRDVDLELPLRRLVAFTGPSGSGKSSLAFDTIHAESVRRFAGISGGRDEPESVAMPDVTSIEGLGVTIGASTRAIARTSRSTVATYAGVADPLRRTFALVARPICTRCGGVGERHDVRAAADAVARFGEGARVVVLALVADGRLDDARATLDALRSAGFVRARLDGVVVDLADAPPLDPKKPHRVEVVVDRFVVRASEPDRAREAVELAYRTSDGSAIVEAEGHAPLVLSRDPRCVRCGEPVEPLPSGAFSPSDPASACRVCAGTGIREHAAKTKRSTARTDDDELRLPDGSCVSCDGTGLISSALDARALGIAYRDAMTAPIATLRAAFERCDDPRARGIATAIARALAFLDSVGLGHLALGRRGHTLSSGEISRARLAGPFANQLVDVTYVLDEPTAGLHPSERPAILDAMRRLVDAGNSVLVVEHDADVVLAADHVVELGPGAGLEGGAVVFAGAPSDLPPDGFTAGLARPWRIEPSPRAASARAFEFVLDGLAPFEDATIDIPLGRISAVAGPSGSGKSTLLAGLAAAYSSEKGRLVPGPRLRGDAGGFDRLVRFDDLSSFPGPRSLVATRLGVFTALRETFAGLPEARARGFDASRFGLHGPGGRCDACEGRGVVRATSARGIDADVPCPRCGGSRYDVAITAVRYRGASIVDVLASSLVEVRARFEAIAAIERPLSHAIGLGLGHLELGRGASAVSAGESTRVRLAAELARRGTDRALLLLDEPCRGLSPRDVRRLTDALSELVDRGATIVLAEHSVALLGSVDVLIDLARIGAGPTSVAATGTPRAVAEGCSPTAPHLARAFAAGPERCPSETY